MGYGTWSSGGTRWTRKTLTYVPAKEFTAQHYVAQTNLRSPRRSGHPWSHDPRRRNQASGLHRQGSHPWSQSHGPRRNRDPFIERGILGIFRVEGGRGERNQRAVEGDDSSSRSPE
ncbi:unnamed protein product [Amoebophrya sp. A25]|nr:unnamed protein product [Amoebophrya sp. A25]|eukprot:GSA25T00027816001.1